MNKRDMLYQELLQVKKDLQSPNLKPRYWKQLPDYITEVMRKVGPKETSYAVEIEAEDHPRLGYFFAAMTTRENPPQFIEYFNELDRRWNDQKDAGVIVKGHKVYFKHVTRTLDIPTIQGLAYAIRIMFQEGILFRYFGVGSDTREPMAFNQQLFAEVTPRMDMTNAAQGSYARVNNSMKFIGLFPAAHGTVTARESGVSNATDNSGTFLNRNTFQDDPIVHTAGGTAFNLATKIALAAVLI